MLGGDINPFGVASGRACSLKICHIKQKELPAVVTPYE